MSHFCDFCQPVIIHLVYMISSCSSLDLGPSFDTSNVADVADVFVTLANIPEMSRFSPREGINIAIAANEYAQRALSIPLAGCSACGCFELELRLDRRCSRWIVAVAGSYEARFHRNAAHLLDISFTSPDTRMHMHDTRR